MPFESPATILYDESGIAIAVSGGIAVPVSTSFLPIGGQTPAGTASMLTVTTSGALLLASTDTSGSFRYSNSYLTHLGALDFSTGKLTSLRASTEGFLLISGSISSVAAGVQTISGTVALSQTAVVRNESNISSSVDRVGRSATNVVLAASNTNRRGLTIYNDSGGQLFVKLGDAATTTTFTIRITSQGYFEVPYYYTGEVNGIWNTGGTGNALVTIVT